MSPDTWATSAAWKKITAGPEYEISTARNPAAMADTDQSRLSVGFPANFRISGTGGWFLHDHPLAGVRTGARGIKPTRRHRGS